MKTVAEFAKDAGVTPKTVYKWLNKVKPFHTNGLTIKKGAVTFITEVGIKALTERFTKVKPETHKGYTEVKQTEAPELVFLREQVKTLTEELNREREHSRTLAEQLADIARNSQILLGAEQTRTNPALLSEVEVGTVDTSPKEAEQPALKKRGFWERIFGK